MYNNVTAPYKKRLLMTNKEIHKASSGFNTSATTLEQDITVLLQNVPGYAPVIDAFRYYIKEAKDIIDYTTKEENSLIDYRISEARQLADYHTRQGERDKAWSLIEDMKEKNTDSLLSYTKKTKATLDRYFDKIQSSIKYGASTQNPQERPLLEKVAKRSRDELTQHANQASLALQKNQKLETQALEAEFRTDNEQRQLVTSSIATSEPVKRARLVIRKPPA